jgi:hypothetical protein
VYGIGHCGCRNPGGMSGLGQSAELLKARADLEAIQRQRAALQVKITGKPAAEVLRDVTGATSAQVVGAGAGGLALAAGAAALLLWWKPWKLLRRNPPRRRRRVRR